MHDGRPGACARISALACSGFHTQGRTIEQWLDAIDRRELDAIICTHALAELYAPPADVMATL